MHKAAGDAEPAALREKLHRAWADRTFSLVFNLFLFLFLPQGLTLYKVKSIALALLLTEKQNSFGSGVILASQAGTQLVEEEFTRAFLLSLTLVSSSSISPPLMGPSWLTHTIIVQYSAT